MYIQYLNHTSYVVTTRLLFKIYKITKVATKNILQNTQNSYNFRY